MNYERITRLLDESARATGVAVALAEQSREAAKNADDLVRIAKAIAAGARH